MLAKYKMYDEYLPPVFPYSIKMWRRRVAEAILTLERKDDRFPNGTSFAVTSNSNKEDHQILWLSRWSAVVLQERGFISNVVPPELMWKD